MRSAAPSCDMCEMCCTKQRAARGKADGAAAGSSYAGRVEEPLPHTKKVAAQRRDDAHRRDAEKGPFAATGGACFSQPDLGCAETCSARLRGVVLCALHRAARSAPA